MNLFQKLFNSVFGLTALCICLALMTAQPAAAQNPTLVNQVSSSDNGNLSKNNDFDNIGTAVVVETILSISINHPNPNITVAGVEVFKLGNRKAVMTAEGCSERTCEFDVSHLPSGFYRVKVQTSHANKRFARRIHISK